MFAAGIVYFYGFMAAIGVPARAGRGDGCSRRLQLKGRETAPAGPNTI